MKTIRNISEKVATPENFMEGYYNYVDEKPDRVDIREYTANLAANIHRQIKAYNLGNWEVPAYEERIIHEHGKKRKLGVYPCREHVMEWAMLNLIEHSLTDSYIRNSCSCVKGRGQTDFIDILSRYMRSDVEGTWYGVQLDIHHYFQWICHELMFGMLERKISDEKLLTLLLVIMNSFPNGLVLGTKLSQIEANFFLHDFDHQAASLWGVRDDVEKMHYWRRRYVNACLETCRTDEQARELNKGVEYLNQKFDRLVERGVYYARFADNIIMMSGDKAFLHICVEIAVMTICRDKRVTINRSWNIRPVEPDGIDVCGYVLHHFYRGVRKRNKQTLWRQVIQLRRKGKTPEEIRLICASRIGWLTHGDCRNLLRKMDVNMEERLGSKIRHNRATIPFEGLSKEQRRTIEGYLCYKEEQSDPEGFRKEEDEKIILLKEYKIDNSIYAGREFRMAVRFQEIDHITLERDEEGKMQTVYHWKDEELYMWTGSQILIDQAQRDFSDRDLPAPTCIHEYTNKFKKKFYKFT